MIITINEFKKYLNLNESDIKKELTSNYLEFSDKISDQLPYFIKKQEEKEQRDKDEEDRLSSLAV